MWLCERFLYYRSYQTYPLFSGRYINFPWCWEEGKRFLLFLVMILNTGAETRLISLKQWNKASCLYSFLIWTNQSEVNRNSRKKTVLRRFNKKCTKNTDSISSSQKRSSFLTLYRILSQLRFSTESFTYRPPVQFQFSCIHFALSWWEIGSRRKGGGKRLNDFYHHEWSETYSKFKDRDKLFGLCENNFQNPFVLKSFLRRNRG